MNDYIFYVCNIGPADPAQLFKLTNDSRLSRVNYLASQMYDSKRKLVFDKNKFKTFLIDKDLSSCIYWVTPNATEEIWKVIWEVITEESKWLTLFKTICSTSDLFIYNIIHMWCKNVSLDVKEPTTQWDDLCHFYERNKYSNEDEIKTNLIGTNDFTSTSEDIPIPVRIRIKGGVIVQNCDVYVGRRCTMGGWNDVPQVAKGNTRWCNPFKGLLAIERYNVHIRNSIKSDPTMITDLKDFRGKTLGCFCNKQGTIDNPLCHATVIAKIYSEIFV
uniref:DUF4326 domain-containing protein n=1 Tax=Pithovirus LCPAC406 TaxID=2506599 RepID=A0A481ZG52_9VIRU|nr:MAG: protein of unknown function DUF4326 [Pithovirus LCPAC406]